MYRLNDIFSTCSPTSIIIPKAKPTTKSPPINKYM